MSEELMALAEEEMQKAYDSTLVELAKVRTGRASLDILDSIRVESYGSLMPLNQVASLAIPEPRMITIQPWDSSVIAHIEKAIMQSDLGMSPNNDGKMIRLNIPTLTEERRKDLVKQVKKLSEDGRIRVRHARREAIDELKKLEKDKEISEDELKTLSDKVQKLTDQYIDKINVTLEKKEKDLLSV